MRRHGERPAVDRVDLDVDDGELLAVVGPSGSGKTTLLRVIAGLDPLDAGEIRIGDRVVAGGDVPPVPPAQRDVAMVFQSFALFPHLTVADNIAFGMAARGVRAQERRAAAGAAAERLGLGDLLERT
ncbi:MAG: ATP-binding cassette domain-containing protein, partial [Actinomycetota bacterium]|nr:ATP-binding cassette domain-containing protein [Actinomycetota bacterium]